MRRQVRQDRRKRARLSLLAVLVAMAAFGILMRWALLRAVVLQGDGMADTLRGGDVVVCVHTLPLPGAKSMAPHKGELALVQVVLDKAHCRVVRRVIATEGDEVFVSLEGKVTVNGQELDEPYATYRVVNPDDIAGSGLIPNPFNLEQDETERQGTDPRWEEVLFPLTVPKGQLFVLADDRNTFDDSRSAAFGLVSEDSVLGLAAAVAWPPERIRLLDDFRLGDHIDALNPLPKAEATPPPPEDGQPGVLN